MLIDKAFNYIKYGLNILRIYPNDLSKWPFFKLYRKKHKVKNIILFNGKGSLIKK